MRYLFALLLLLAAPLAVTAQVDPEKGSFTVAQDDIVLRSAGRELALQRVYNSHWPSTGSFGTGWGTYYETSLTTMPDGAVFISEYGIGKTRYYLPTDIEQVSTASIRSARPARTPPPVQAVSCVQGRLVRLEDGYQRTVCGGVREYFDALGRLVRITSPDRYMVRIFHDGRHVREIRDSQGQHIALERSASGRIIAARAESKLIKYEYNRSSLVSVAVAGANNDNRTDFAYESDKKLTTIRVGATAPKKITYDTETGRVESVSEPNGALATYTVREDPSDPQYFLVRATLISPSGEQLSREWKYRTVEEDSRLWKEIVQADHPILLAHAASNKTFH